MSERIEQAAVVKKANVYFDGQCVSHTVLLADGSRKRVGGILPSTLRLTTGAPEVMELVEGRCRVTLPSEDAPREYRGGESFSVPGDSAFDIETLETLHYVCHFGCHCG